MSVLDRLSLWLGEKDNRYLFSLSCWLERRIFRWRIFKDCIKYRTNEKFRKNCNDKNYFPFNFK